MARFCAPIPEVERDDLIAAYHRRLFCGDTTVEVAHAQAWLAWENALAGFGGEGGGGSAPVDSAPRG